MYGLINCPLVKVLTGACFRRGKNTGGGKVVERGRKLKNISRDCGGLVLMHGAEIETSVYYFYDGDHNTYIRCSHCGGNE
jgi:hypothetical protein